MDLEFLGAGIGVLGALVGGIWWAAVQLTKIDGASHDIIGMMDRMDKFERRINAIEDLAAVVNGFGTSVTEKFNHITEVMGLHVSNNKQQFADLKATVKEIRETVRKVG